MTTAAELAAIARSVANAYPQLHTEWVASIDSTNSALMRRAASGETAPTLLIADAQTAGRGRMGKQWHSSPAGALTFSIGLPLAPADWSGLSLAVGVTVASALRQWAQAQALAPQQSNARLGLKWPNDIWLMDAQGRGRKMAGILIETAALHTIGAPAPGRYAVIGIGLNLTAQPADGNGVAPIGLTQWLALPAAMQQDMQALRAALLQAIAPALLMQLPRFVQQGFGGFADAYAAWDLLRGRAVTLSDGRSGRCLGVDAKGALLLADGSGGTTAISSGEVSVRPIAAPVP
ncbi:hypothetical protein AAV94_03750 [Lampropedia cohaerens]|uniref:biotin--[biotin carboxyl-carrier protein] ligase n=1 Tax=Lampropedia cohaerens TaxID=1610491 RepID=A0A0U1Q1M1_9BURK|nr:biotin--[acetyl-CoA-carboxylase] ligase [Lampropedia cohaerens]KKW68653.1 hypothetical protein AAV94_03750 [Lampropedia cohaerens]